MQTSISRDAIVVSDESFRSDDPDKILWSNIRFLDSLFAEGLTNNEASADALFSYHVEYYLEQVENGGFSQFIYNSRWQPKIILNVREGLRAMNATRHLELFGEVSRQVEQLGKERLTEFFKSDYFGNNAVRDELDALSERFYELSKQENLHSINAAWLRQHPNLVAMTKEQMEEDVRRRAEAMPDHEQRIAELRSKEPRYKKLLRALCARAGQKFDQTTSSNSRHEYDGSKTTAWHFITNQGHHHMVEAGGKAIMFRGHSTTDRVCEVDAEDVVGRT
jgi:hypothetical protein